AKSAEGVGSGRFWPWDTLSRLLWQTPLLLALSTAACLAVVADFARRGKTALHWDGKVPEALLLLGALAALFVNPTPFPYNLVNLAPFAFILAFKYGAELWNKLREYKQFQPFVAAVLVFGHLLPFGIATERHLNWPNSRQRTLMHLAETMTDPAKDPVYDGVGMVLTRPSIDYMWYLHSLNIQLFLDKQGHHVRDLLAKQPAAVLILNYRTDWLPDKDHQFIEKRYLPLADDFWVLGARLPAGGGAFEIFHDGRYCFVPIRKTPHSDTTDGDSAQASLPEVNARVTGTLDGAPLPNHPVELSFGVHHLDTPKGYQPAVVWVGPHLDQLPHLKPGNHQTLFVNWY
ncbi:MAG TPA: hypothetical protein VKA67_05750, partial [Verrucomicrobiae bacterium]|nr:hypothetical protein [Verrucomicrobiae bacterium]